MFCYKNLKGHDCLGISLKMLGVVALAFFVITIWSSAMTWVHSVNPWYFLIAAVVLIALAKLRFWKKKKK